MTALSILTAANPQQARCPVCGQEFAPPPAVVAAITREVRSQKSEAELSCLDLPASAFADPRLLSACPHCQHPLQFNPFFAAADDYAEVLRRGLEQSRREKGADHEETLAHLAALAAHWKRLANPKTPPSSAGARTTEANAEGRMKNEECRTRRTEGRYGSRGLSHLGIGGFRLTR